MISKGWDHGHLNEMYEDEFLFWLDTQMELEDLKAEAEREALED